MYKAINTQGERRLFHHLTEACEFAGKSYHSVYRAFKLRKSVDGIEEVSKYRVQTISRSGVENIVIANFILHGKTDNFFHMEPDGSILFV